MADNEKYVVVTDDNFQEVVLNSDVPVLVDVRTPLVDRRLAGRVEHDQIELIDIAVAGEIAIGPTTTVIAIASGTAGSDGRLDDRLVITVDVTIEVDVAEVGAEDLAHQLHDVIIGDRQVAVHVATDVHEHRLVDVGPVTDVAADIDAPN